MTTKKIADVSDRILDKLEELERNMMWLSKKTEIPYNSLYSLLVRKDYDMSQENLKKINAVLETDFKL